MALFRRLWFRPPPPLEVILPAPLPEGTETVAYVDSRAGAEDAVQPRLLVTALGPEGAELEQQIASICATSLRDGFWPVTVATGLPTRYLVAARTPVEIMPRRAELAILDVAEYAAYAGRRWELILGKWQISQIVHLAMSFDEFLAAEMEGRAERER